VKPLALNTSTPLVDQVKAADPKTWGPAMAALSDKLRAYVVARVQLRLIGEQAVIAIGSPAETKASREVIASRYNSDPRVIAAMQEMVSAQIVASAPEALRVVQEVARGKHGAKAADRLKAAGSLLDRGGLAGVQRVEVDHRHEHTVNLTNEELLADLERMLGKPVPQRALEALPLPADAIDAEFEPADEWTVIG
jgi:hypothetical protein